MSLLAYFLLFGTILLSGTSIFLFRKISKRALKLLLAFSGAYLFALTVMHLAPEVYRSSEGSIGFYILAGFLIQILLEVFSEGIEHGHIHVHKHRNAAFPYGVMFGLCLHSYLEGMPLAQTFSSEATRTSLLAGIILHHIPVALALMSMLLDSGVRRSSAVFFLFLFALMAPLGAVTGSWLSVSAAGDLSVLFHRIMAVVIGIFLHISTTILFESSEEHRFNYYKFLTILLGAGLALLS